MFTIRPTKVADASCLPAIERSAGAVFLTVPNLAWIATDSVTTEERHLELIHNGVALVAADGADEPVGFLGAEMMSGNLHIWQLAVRHELQGRGLGRKLLGSAESWACAHAMSGLTLTTFRAVAWNEPFYQRCGFRTLEADGLSEALRRILDEETKSGLPADQRCAMARKLR